MQWPVVLGAAALMTLAIGWWYSPRSGEHASPRMANAGRPAAAQKLASEDPSAPLEAKKAGTLKTGPPAPPRRYVPTPQTSRIASSTPEGILYLPEVAEMGHSLHAPGGTAEEDLDILQNLLAIYRKVNHGANPDGGLNREIVARMRGQNPMKFAVLPPDLRDFNAEGELLDRWESPYFFHPVSRQVMEIRSAGPDRKLWTKDDIQPEVGAAAL